MRQILSLVLYTALAVGANSAQADFSAIEALRTGDMKKLVFHSDPQPVSQVGFIDENDNPHDLGQFQGKYIVLNFWTTWCAPCRKEMPMLAELQTEFGGDSFEVVTIATGRNLVPGMIKFFEEIEVDNLPLYRDPKQALAREMAVLGLPITVILDPNGYEIARLRGDAHWSSDSAKAIIAALLDESA
jgi:thiol-disulfide isomerase/thioredoxin